MAGFATGVPIPDGLPGLRDWDLPCEEYEPRGPHENPEVASLARGAGDGDLGSALALVTILRFYAEPRCEGDGHWLCPGCSWWKWRGREPEYEEAR